jgi:hypothetical protein
VTAPEPPPPSAPHTLASAARDNPGVRNPYAALDAFLTEHRLCRPGLDDPDVSPMLVCLWCSCGAQVTVRLQPVPA